MFIVNNMYREGTLLISKRKNTATKDYIEFHDEACAVQYND